METDSDNNAGTSEDNTYTVSGKYVDRKQSANIDDCNCGYHKNSYGEDVDKLQICSEKEL